MLCYGIKAKIWVPHSLNNSQRLLGMLHSGIRATRYNIDANCGPKLKLKNIFAGCRPSA